MCATEATLPGFAAEDVVEFLEEAIHFDIAKQHKMTVTQFAIQIPRLEGNIVVILPQLNDHIAC